MIAEAKRRALINYRIDLAKETLRNAELFTNNNKLKSAIKNVYQGMFNMLLAVGLKHQFVTPQPHQLISWFNKNFVYTGKINPEFGAIIINLFKVRTRAENDGLIEFSKEKVDEMFNGIKKLVNSLEKNILSE